MRESDLIEEGFEKIIVTAEESGGKNDYYYYNYKLNEHCSLTSNESDLAYGNNWIVRCFEINLVIKDLVDLQYLIALFAKSAKIK